jgi:hypothetical protein
MVTRGVSFAPSDDEVTTALHEFGAPHCKAERTLEINKLHFQHEL